MRSRYYGQTYVLISLITLLSGQAYGQKIAVLGAGYVGLVTSVVLADVGHTIICADVDDSKIKNLNMGKIPIFEPGLQELLSKVLAGNNGHQSNLVFTTSVDKAIQSSDVIVLAVGTPTGEDGNANLDALKEVCKVIAQNMNNHKIICLKSTVPVGTHLLVKDIIEQVSPDASFDIVNNPEFLREGSALKDFVLLNPIVVGTSSEYARQTMQEIYQPLLDANPLELIATDNVTAAMIKYCWNSFSAIKVSYVNEIAALCQATGADVFTVIKGMSSSDKLLPVKNIIPGPGYGGSCLPKDTRAFSFLAKKLGTSLRLVNAAIQANADRKQSNVTKILNLLSIPYAQKTVALLGLSFKANTDDIRYSAALDIIPQLLAQGIRVQVYDPAAMENVKKIYPQINYCSSSYEAMSGADLIVILTEWAEFKEIDFTKVVRVGKKNIILDTRYILHLAPMLPAEFEYCN